MKQPGLFVFCVTLCLTLSLAASAVERFPPPEFVETQHIIPSPTTPHPRQDVFEYLDVFVLAAALVLASYLILRKRSRRAVFILMLFSLAYFGFYRKGCVCPIGAIQNVVLTIFDPGYAIPVTVIAFFLLPLVFALFFGRVFCAAVCPLGAIQDVVLLKPVAVPQWLESALRLFAYVYLAAAVLLAATGSAFVICRYDPFVAFFRLTGSLNILILGVCILLIGVFIGRPYCRFICPYGVILRQLSRVSRKRVTVTPDECIKCRLCEDVCPFSAIREPTAEWSAQQLAGAKKQLAFFIALLPLLVAGSGFAGSATNAIAARTHSTVRLADRIYLEEAGKVEGTTDASSAFRATGTEIAQLYDEASAIISHFKLGGWIVGGFIGLVIGLKLVALTTNRHRTDYEADKASCLACARCFRFCPREQTRLKNAKEAMA